MAIWEKISILLKPILPRPERIRNANKFYPVAYSEDVKGCPFKVQDMEELYSLARYVECLEEDVTIITVKDSDGAGTKKRYELVDISAIDGDAFLPEAWEEFTTGGGSIPEVTYMDADYVDDDYVE